MTILTARMRAAGYGMPEHDSYAYKLLRKLGTPEAKLEISTMIMVGILNPNIKNKYDEALKNARAAAKSKNKTTKESALATVYAWEYKLKKRSKESAIQELSKLANNGNARAATLMSDFATLNDPKGIKWAKRGHELGDPWAGTIYWDRTYIKPGSKFEKEMTDVLTKSLMRGNPLAATRLLEPSKRWNRSLTFGIAQMLRTGKNINGTYMVGSLYRSGWKGVPQNLKEAAKYLEIAASAGHVLGTLELVDLQNANPQLINKNNAAAAVGYAQAAVSSGWRKKSDLSRTLSIKLNPQQQARAKAMSSKFTPELAKARKEHLKMQNFKISNKGKS